MRNAIVFAAMAIIVAGCSTNERPIRQVGYFKSDANDRIFTAKMKTGATELDARRYAENAAHTEGRMTAVYIFPSESVVPADGITFAKSIFQANAILDAPQMSAWRYAFIRHRNGTTVFVDCLVVKSEPCKQTSARK